MFNCIPYLLLTVTLYRFCYSSSINNNTQTNILPDVLGLSSHVHAILFGWMLETPGREKLRAPEATKHRRNNKMRDARIGKAELCQ